MVKTKMVAHKRTPNPNEIRIRGRKKPFLRRAIGPPVPISRVWPPRVSPPPEQTIDGESGKDIDVEEVSGKEREKGETKGERNDKRGEEEEDIEAEVREKEREEEDKEVGGEDENVEERDGEDEVSLDDEAPVALLPHGLYFPASEYTKKIKISTRCYIHEVLTLFENLSTPLTRAERGWFEQHPQFRHIFHMPRGKNHMIMGMWMLLLRTARIEKKKEVWFIVNGVPVRYSMKEHALISGLNCRDYEPFDYEEKAGSDSFWKKNFPGLKSIKRDDVKNALEEMVPNRSNARLKMLVLYFLCSIIGAPTKTGQDATPVDMFLLRAVDDLNFCTEFAWGRWTFERMLREIQHTMNHFAGVVQGNLWPIPGFCLPLEFLPFEAIPALGTTYREIYQDADPRCPRMCKKVFKKT